MTSARFRRIDWRGKFRAVNDESQALSNYFQLKLRASVQRRLVEFHDVVCAQWVHVQINSVLSKALVDVDCVALIISAPIARLAQLLRDSAGQAFVIKAAWRSKVLQGCIPIFQNLEYGMPQSMLLPQDVVVLAKLLTYKGHRPTIARLAADLFLSASQVHAALKRLEQSRLLSPTADGGRPILKSVEEFLVHGLPYVFPPHRGAMTRGVPTGYAAPPLNQTIEPGDEPPPVWPAPDGKVRGTSLEPLYKTVPKAVSNDSQLYELLALIDAVRDGRARERAIATRELTQRVRSLLHG